MTPVLRPWGDPPRWARLLLRLLPEKTCEVLRGDLDEEYTSHMLPTRGRWRADLWYTGQALGALWHLRVKSQSKGDRGHDVGRGRVARMDQWTQDLRYAVRGLITRPGFAAVAVLTLALGIGATTAIFGIVHRVVLRPLPFAEADRLVRIAPDDLFYTNRDGVAYFIENTTEFSGVSGWGRSLFLLTGDGEAEELRGGIVSTNHFDMLGATPILGRGFLPEESTAANAGVVILRHRLWVRRFGSDPDLVGQEIEIGGRLTRVVGVLGPDHQPVEHDWDLWSPIVMDEGHPHENAAMSVNARLAAHGTLQSAHAEALRLFRGAAEHAGNRSDEDWLAQMRVVTMKAWILGDYGDRLIVLLAAVGFVLLISCANVANLLLARGHGRRQEFGIRSALGAGRWRIMHQLLIESLVLALAGGGMGVALAAGILSGSSGWIPASVPRAAGSGVNLTVMVFALAASLGCALVFGVIPALRASRTDIRSVLSGDLATSSGGGRRNSHGVTHTLIALEIALAVVLLIGSGLTMRSLWTLVTQDPGFNAENVVVFRPRPSRARYATPESMAQYFDRVTEEIERLPSVQAVGSILFLPMQSGGAWGSYSRPGFPVPDNPPSVAFRRVTPDYFRAMGIAVVAGRAFTDEDRGEGPGVVVLNETAVRQAFGTEDPIGQMIETGLAEGPQTVIGVVRDVRQTTLAAPSHPELYVSYEQSPSSRRSYAVRVTGDPAAHVAAIQRAVWSVDDEVPLLGMTNMGEVVRATTSDSRFLAVLMGSFAAVALILGAIGVYGVMTYLMGLQRKAIGLRIALGAPGQRVVRDAVLNGMIPVLVGTSIGLALATALARALQSILYQIGPMDPLTFVLVPVVLVVTAIAAVYLPARAVSRTDPMLVLRES